jgi:hypothetical protein
VQQATGKGASRGKRQWTILWPWDGVLVEVGELAAAGRRVCQIRPEDVGLQAKIDDLVARMPKLVVELAGGGRCQSKRQYTLGEHLVDHAAFANEGGMESLVPGACL